MGFIDPYLDDQGLLRNLVHATSRNELLMIESEFATANFLSLASGVPRGRRTFDTAHLQAVHQHLFGDVYPWAGQLRTVDISKGSSTFMPVVSLGSGLAYTWDRVHNGSLLVPDCDDETFVHEMAEYLSDINYVHPFREGNGRSSRALAHQVAIVSGHQIQWSAISRSAWIDASITTFEQASGDAYVPLLEAAIGPVQHHLHHTPGDRVVDHGQQYPPPVLELSR